MSVSTELSCRFCGSDNLKRIVYGYPTQESVKGAELGKFILGGCAISNRSPTYRCMECGEESITYDEFQGDKLLAKTLDKEEHIEDIENFLMEMALDENRAMILRKAAVRHIRDERRLKELRVAGSSAIQKTVLSRLRDISSE